MGAAAQTLAALRTAVARIETSEADRSSAPRRIALGVAELDAALGGGMKRGALHVASAGLGGAAAATGFVATLARLAIGHGRAALWIRQDMAAREAGEPWGPGLVEIGLDPARLIMLRVRDLPSTLKAAEAGLACSALGCVVIEPFGAMAGFDRVAGRRLALAAARSGALGLMLRAAPSTASPAGFSAAETRWRILPLASDAVGAGVDWGRPLIRAELVRNRLGSLGRWPLAFGHEDGAFRLAERRFAGSNPSERQDRDASVAKNPRGGVSGPVDRQDQAAREAAREAGGEAGLRRAG